MAFIEHMSNMSGLDERAAVADLAIKMGISPLACRLALFGSPQPFEQAQMPHSWSGSCDPLVEPRAPAANHWNLHQSVAAEPSSHSPSFDAHSLHAHSINSSVVGCGRSFDSLDSMVRIMGHFSCQSAPSSIRGSMESLGRRSLPELTSETRKRPRSAEKLENICVGAGNPNANKRERVCENNFVGISMQLATFS